jgi:hypothetical protein
MMFIPNAVESHYGIWISAQRTTFQSLIRPIKIELTSNGLVGSYICWYETAAITGQPTPVRAAADTNPRRVVFLQRQLFTTSSPTRRLFW